MSLERIEKLFVIYSTILLFALFLILSFNVFVADSEFWSIALGYHFWSDIGNDWVYTRPLYYLTLWISQIFYFNPEFSVYSARALFLLNSLVISILMIKIVQKKTGSYHYGIAAVALLFANTGYLNQGFRVRSDILTTTLTLIAIYRLESSNKSSKVFFLLPLLSTPKAVLDLAALAIGYISKDVPRKKYVLTGVAATIVWVLVNWKNLDFVMHYFIDINGPSYFSYWSWEHLANQIFRNSLFWIIFCFGLLHLKEAFLQRKSITITLLLLVFLMVVSPGKTQFFISSFLPFISVFIGLFLYDLHNVRPTLSRALVIISVSGGLLFGGSWFIVNWEQNRNTTQLDVLNGFYRAFVSDKSATYFDGTCLIAPNCSLRNFVGPNQPQANKNALFMLGLKNPTFIFALRKMDYLQPEFGVFLSTKYVELMPGSNIFVDKSQIENSTTLETHRRLTSWQTNRLDSTFGYDIDY